MNQPHPRPRSSGTAVECDSRIDTECHGAEKAAARSKGRRTVSQAAAHDQLLCIFAIWWVLTHSSPAGVLITDADWIQQELVDLNPEYQRGAPCANCSCAM